MKRLRNKSFFWPVVLCIVLIFLLLSYLIWKMPHLIYLPTQAEVQRNAQIGVTLVAVFVLILMSSYYLASRRSGKVSFDTLRRTISADDHAEPEVATPQSRAAGLFTTLVQNLRRTYGLLWRRKVRIVMVVGNPEQVEQAVPDLTQQVWQESNGYVLVWGGDLAEADSQAAREHTKLIRRLRRRPLDAVVWVTTPEAQTGEVEAGVRQLHEHYRILGWQVPLYLWELHISPWDQGDWQAEAIGCLLPPACTPETLGSELQTLSLQLSRHGVGQVLADLRHNFLLWLAQSLDDSGIARLKNVATPLLTGVYAVPLSGVMFGIPAHPGHAVEHSWPIEPAWEGLLHNLPKAQSRRVGFSWTTALQYTLLVLAGFWLVGSVLSLFTNHAQINTASEKVARAIDSRQDLTTRLQNQQALQQQMARLQQRMASGAPWYSRFGLNQDQALLTALWPGYQYSNAVLLRDEAAKILRERLQALIALAPEEREGVVESGYDQLKAYLMMARPEKADAAFLTRVLMQNWPQRTGVADTLWRDLGPALLTFYGQNLPAHPQWRITADDEMVNEVRRILLQQIGIHNAEATMYQKLLQQVARNYPDMRLSDMTGDTDASQLFTTSKTVPGVFTRKAWEEQIQKAIDKVVRERREEIDWVLHDGTQPVDQGVSPEALQARLTERYFADFSRVWLVFLNSLQWRQAASLSENIDHLTLMADVRQSPLIALMNTIAYQGKTGQRTEGLSDSLVKSAQNLLNADKRPQIEQNNGPQGPLDSTFGPVLALLDGNNKGSLSLQTFLTRVTGVRLKLQQVTNAPDPQAMIQAMAQTVFQGKAVDLTDTRDYGSLIAASLGGAWSGFSQTVFVLPLEQAWQQVLTPTAASLNRQWRNGIVRDWNTDFSNRYPFTDTQSDASLPLLSQYLNSRSGRIAQFVQDNLGGVLHKTGRYWAPNTTNAQGLTFNPDFLVALNRLSELADIAFAGGDAGLHFELMAQSAPEVVETELVLGQQKLTYFNQKQRWQTFNWPDSQWQPHVTLSWKSVTAGSRLYADQAGAWGFIRLLEKARFTAIDSTTWHLVWQAPNGPGLNYLLRTESGKGPLALLALKNFRLPETIFINTGSNIE